MATLTSQRPTVTGAALTMQAAAGGGDKAKPGAFVLVTNGGVGSITVTVAVPGTEYGQARADIPVTVAAGASKMIGPLPSDLRGTDGLVALTYSGVTSVTVAAIEAS